MSVDNLNSLLELLSQRESSDTVFNQYKDRDILNNLRLYLEYVLANKNDTLFIGEAPGYRGCGLTGIPFSSGRLIEESNHKMFKELREKIKLKEIASEKTASILWSFIDNKQAPLLWNAFPFHPHKKNNIASNRKPTKSEIEEGRGYLLMITELFNPTRLCALGRVGELTLKRIFPNQKIIYIRHPSYGGKKDFINGMKFLQKTT